MNVKSTTDPIPMVSGSGTDLTAPLLFEHLFESAADAIVLVDNHDRVVRVNPAFEQMFGYRAEKCVGRPLNSLIVDEGFEREASSISSQVLAGERVRFESLRKTRSGELLHVEISGVPINSETDGQVGLFGIYRDVTAQRSAEDRLKESESAYRIMAESTGQLVYDYDLMTGCIRWHGAVDAVLGCSPAAAEGIDIEQWEKRIHEDDRPRALALLERAQRRGERYQAEYRFERSDGEFIIVADSGSFLCGANGKSCRMIGTMSDVTERRRIERQVKWQAEHDALTGLYNRHKFQAAGDALLAEREPGKSRQCLLYIDLDRFKVVNDTGGHLAGDELLKRLAEVLSGQVRNTDLLARLGGDEFALLLCDCAVDQAKQIADELVRKVDQFSFNWESRRFHVGASIGLVAIGPRESLTDALRRADQACYIAKQKGRNQTHVYRDNDHANRSLGRNVRSAIEVTDALAENRFVLYYQEIHPLCRNDYGRHREILLRMMGRDGAILPPGAFIPGAERFNWIMRLDRWVVAQTLAGLRCARDHGRVGPGDRFSINLCGASFGQPQFLEFVRRQFEVTGVDPKNVCFEITESSAISGISDALAFIKAVRAMGCSICLDDFGSGFSSFGYLKMLPVDRLKIDGSLVRDIGESLLGRAMVRGIVEIAHAADIPCVAEQVESETERELLRDMGVDYIQGVVTHRPESWPFDPSDRQDDAGSETDIASR